MAEAAAFAVRERMFRRVSRVAVAVSGGADSVACLLVLLALRERIGFEVLASHFDHQLRPASAGDMESVRALCAGLGVECITGEGDVAAEAARQHRGIEETARAMRYQFLAFVAGKQGADCIATGHTADDQAETVLMRIVRGAGVRGIRGILPVSSVPGAAGVRLVRPLLTTGRPETEAICAEAGITPLVDLSNEDRSFTRNRVRLDVLDSLKALNPAVGDALRGLAESARQAFDPIEKRSMEVQPLERGAVGSIFDLGPFRELPNEALTLVVEREAPFYHLRTETNRTRVENLRDALAGGSGAVTFGEAVAEVSSGRVRIGPPLDPVEPIAAAVLNVPGVTRAGPWLITAATGELPSAPESPVAAIPGNTRGALRARSLARGDRLQFHRIERKVSDLLVNEKVPAWERQRMLAITDSERVLAIMGSAVSFAADTEGEPSLWVRRSERPAAG